MKLTIYTPTIGIKLIIAKYCINYCENNKDYIPMNILGPTY